MEQLNFATPSITPEDVANPYYRKSERMPLMDLFAGIASFSKAAEETGRFKTIMTSEIDSYCSKLIDQKYGYENAGCIESLGTPAEQHKDKTLTDDDIVPCEHTGLSSICLEDFYDGSMEFPFVITGGFPCTEVTLANSTAEGVNGGQSELVDEQLRIIRALEPQYCIFENSNQLVNRGLDQILTELKDIGYIVEWETISAATYGYPHYRHRCYVVAYLPSSKAATSGTRIFDLVRANAPESPDWKLPLNTAENAEAVLNSAVAHAPREFKLRTKRINALGNTVILDIVRAIFNAILSIQDGKSLSPQGDLVKYAESTTDSWDAKGPKSKLGYITFPPSGYMKNGIAMAPALPCRKLNPTKTQFTNMFSTLIKKDGNNNFTCKSRTSRPGKLGGLIGDIMKLGADHGGLHPEFAEVFMGYEKGHTAL